MDQISIKSQRFDPQRLGPAIRASRTQSQSCGAFRLGRGRRARVRIFLCLFKTVKLIRQLQMTAFYISIYRTKILGNLRLSVVVLFHLPRTKTTTKTHLKMKMIPPKLSRPSVHLNQLRSHHPFVSFSRTKLLLHRILSAHQPSRFPIQLLQAHQIRSLHHCHRRLRENE